MSLTLRQSPRTNPWLTMAAILVAGWPVVSAAQSCDAIRGTTIRFVIPNAAGGGYDAYGRLLKPFIEQALDATVYIDNVPDAGGIVGASAIRDAKADAGTLGLINATGLLAAQLGGRAPDPAGDFTILGRVVSNHTVMLTGGDSGIGDLNDLLRVAAERPIVIGVRDAGSSSLLAVPATAALLGIRYELVTGYVGSTARALAAIRGEIDVLMQNFDSTRRFVDTGQLRLLLQLSSPPPGYTQLAQVPALAGAHGAARRRADETGIGVGQAGRQAEALAVLAAAGRLLVAPPSLPDETRECLQTTTVNILGSTELLAVAERAALRIDAADASAVKADLEIANQALAEFAPLLRAAMRRARQ